MTGRELRLERESAGVKQKAVAAEMGLSAGYVCLVETGRVPMSRGFEARYRRALRAAQRGRRRTSKALRPVVRLEAFLAQQAGGT